MSRLILYISLIMTIPACSSGPYSVSSPYYKIPPGSQLILKQALEIPPNTGRVYIQYGKVVNNGLEDKYYANCWFVSWEISDNKTIIKPDTFTVIESKKDEIYAKKLKPVQLATSGVIQLASDGYSATAIEYTTTLTIQSKQQQNIREFSCSHWEDPIDENHLTVKDINNALGDIAELKIISK